MIKYKNFEEYIQYNYFDVMNERLSKYIIQKELKKQYDSNNVKDHEYSINLIRVEKIRFTKKQN